MEKNIVPICCVLGHVDVGKTKLLDYLRSTHTKEVSGITQQIGTTVFNGNTLKELCGKLSNNIAIEKLIMIDTPGHSNFTTMRQVGSVISNLVIVVIDIIKGIEEETKKCLKFVKEIHGENFIIVLNKLDKINEWNSVPKAPLTKTYNKNKKGVKFVKDHINNIICQLAGLEINACAYYDNKDIDTFVSMVPVSAASGEGIPDLILLISKMMERETKKLKENPMNYYSFGYFLDKRYEDKIGNFNVAVNINKTLKVNDKIIIIDRDNKTIVHENTVKNIVIQTEGKEMKDKSRYKHIDNINGTNGIGIFLNDDIDVSSGSIYANITDMNDDTKNELIYNMKNMITCNSSSLMCQYDKREYGVYLYSPSINIMSALISGMLDNKIPIYDHTVGRLTKEIIIKMSGAYDRIKEPYKTEYLDRYKIILIFNPTVDQNNILGNIDDYVLEMCKKNKIKLIGEKTIYKLVDSFNNYISECDDKFYTKYKNIGEEFELKILSEYIFMKSTPLVIGVKIINGTLKTGTIVEGRKNNKKITLGTVTGIQKNKKNVNTTKVGDEVCIKIENPTTKITYGNDFDDTYTIGRYMTEDEMIISDFINTI